MVLGYKTNRFPVKYREIISMIILYADEVPYLLVFSTTFPSQTHWQQLHFIIQRTKNKWAYFSKSDNDYKRNSAWTKIYRLPWSLKKVFQQDIRMRVCYLRLFTYNPPPPPPPTSWVLCKCTLNSVLTFENIRSYLLGVGNRRLCWLETVWG